jgi:hypothetical protein
MRQIFSIIFIIFVIKFSILFLYIILIDLGLINQLFLLDDIGYYNILLSNFQKLDNNFDIITLRSIAGGYNSFYYIVIFYSFKLFGFNYFSPLILNSIIFCFTLCVFSILYLKYYKDLFLFIFYPDLFFWSTFFNLKESLIYSALLLFIISNNLKNYYFKLFILAFSIFLIFNTRFYYVPILFLTFLIFEILKKFSSIAFNSTFLYIFLSLLFIYFFILFFNLKIPKQTNPFYGFIHFIFTPLPWSINNKYSFLLFGSILNPILFLYYFSKKNIISKLNFVDLFIFLLILFYSISDELQGPRHKSPILLLILISLIHEKRKSKNYFTYCLESVWRSREKS